MSDRPRHRSRAGCLTCKQKHVKCDEARPNCQKCLQKGLACGGYARGLVWSYKHQPTRRHKPNERQNSQSKKTKQVESDVDPIVQSPPQVDITEATPGTDDFVSLSLLPFDVFDDGSSQLWDADMCVTSPSSLQTTSLLPDMEFSASPTLSLSPRTSITSISSQEPTIWNQISLSAAAPIPTIPQTPCWTEGPDATLALINSWFDQVCPAWSAFDSTVNLNRKLANSLWHHSASVFNSLQSMSAGFLSARLPHLRRQALSLFKTASVCVQAEIDELKSKPRIDVFPTGLLFSLLCLGTSVCWLDARLLGLPYLKEARALLRRLRDQDLAIGEDELENFLFFKNSLVYWEMLLAVVADSDVVGTLGDSVSANSNLQRCEKSSCETSTDLSPHPWTGISSRTSRLFLRSVTLCREYRRILTKPTGRVITLSAAMDSFQEARQLEQQLLELDYSSMSKINETGDQKTPWLHLASAAEAYQLSALLQLYVTFPDLVSMRLQADSSMPSDDCESWDKFIIPLTLDLIKVLEKIPPDSGSRVIQPVLYICASTGLRYNSSNAATSPPPNPSTNSPQRRGSNQHSPLDCNSTSILEYVDEIGNSGHAQTDVCLPRKRALDISTSREFIIRRLNILENTLQPRPIVVAKELVKAIWTAYDTEPAGCINVHWLDVMEAHDLRSLFG
ncbi:Zn(2)-C6 fungal-type DNA-binding domain-containing protein [Pochonia chlamydosporia 170]|uniref:Zn(2)-C6 fungal-type DNA-binding domain-containing protein n=1 Tax=Pochonia chlamydosporia 170 TaxID=1380566 RepID=A0A179FIY3_METCM|nr:Zn(2)-C6 fungal-type DNA-binding domain-containing protein [Pochonia chlamydosporia 170]OAQ65502.1 Zn(2)-C6 fungal-type DNA-binding domain-containing protein [Pochonia chlamydosporia 170]